MNSRKRRPRVWEKATRKIDHQEFEVITQHLTATMAWDTRQSALLYQEVDPRLPVELAMGGG